MVLRAYQEHLCEEPVQLVEQRRRSTLRDDLPGHDERIAKAKDRYHNSVENMRLLGREVLAPKLESV